MPTSLAELEARVAALEAERADYRAVLTAVNALAENQREHAQQVRDTNVRVRSIESSLATTDGRVRSIEDNLAEVKDLLIRALDQ